MTSMTDTDWRDFLRTAREQLAAELNAIQTPVRTAHALGRVRNLRLSLDAIDIGPQVFAASGWELENSKLGALMIAGGFEVVGADPRVNFGGSLPWFGSLPEVEARLAAVAKAEAKRAAEAAEAALTDEQRAAREADRAALREAFNAMKVRLVDGQLTPVDAEGLPLEELTDLQKRAIAETQSTFR
jgi:hypothetical protein